MNNPLVSVIIATYRREQSLREAIKSVCLQTYNNIEIVVIDDNDEKRWNKIVKSVVDSFASNSDTKIVFLENHPNMGSAATRNLGIEASSGEYITFLDDDDKYLPNKVRNQLTDIVEKNADYSLTDFDLYYDNGILCERRRRSFLRKEADLLLCHLKYHLTGTDTMMFRKSYLLRIGGFEPIDVGDEYYLMMKAIRGGGVFSYLPKSEVIASVHVGDEGLSSGSGKIKGENDLYEYKKQFFPSIRQKDIRYIKMRHRAVLAFAYLRDKKYLSFFKNALFAFLSSPYNCVILLVDRRKI